jgi:hypothetical protein
MLSPSRGPERLIRMGQWLIALLFAYFLIQVGSSLIADLPLLAKAPQLEQFVDRSRLEPLLAELKPLTQARDDLQGSLEGVRQKEVEAREAYATDKASFDNWRSARSATEQSGQNPEVIARVRQLDTQLDQQRRLSRERQGLEQQLGDLQSRIRGPQSQVRQLQSEAQARWEKALQGRNQCPSCECSLSRSDGQLPNFCMHCGLQIQHDCPRCNHHHLSFFPYCPSCGLAAPTAES